MTTDNRTPQPWHDAPLTAALSTICQVGENQEVQFKEAVPKQANDLAKSMASFATCNAETIYLGIDDKGQVVAYVG